MLKIPVFLSSDNNYAPFLATTMVSILKNTNEFIEFYILDCGISKKYKEKIKGIKKYFSNFLIEFLEVDVEKYFKNFKELQFISKAMYGRYLIAELKPEIKRAIYSDVDVTFVNDIKILWEEDLERFSLGAVPSQRGRINNNYSEIRKKLGLSNEHSFFMTGLFLIDCEKWRSDNVCDKLMSTTIDMMDKVTLPDQEVFNVVFDNKYKKLSPKYCLIYKIFDECYSKEEIEEYTKNQVVVHYPGTKESKPWNNKNLKSAEYFWQTVKYSNFEKEIKKINKNFNKSKENKMSFLQNIFSVKNSEIRENKRHKIITILGARFKFKKKLKKYEIETQNLKSEINKLKNDIKVLRYTLNTCVDIKLAPKARGNLRKLQKADVIMLGIFDNIAKKYNLNYWCDYGTLLGAIRHKGFIPWDDDIDLGILRCDYERIRTELKQEFLDCGFEVNEGKGYYRQVLRLIYKKSAVQIDLWPYDFYYKEVKSVDDKNKLINDIRKCHTMFFDKYPLEKVQNLNEFPIKELLRMQNDIVQKNNPEIKKTLFGGSEAIVYNNPRVYDKNDIFPLNQTEFEDIKLNIPNNFDNYLTLIYGDYLKFPNFSDVEMLAHGNIAEKLGGIDDILEEIEKNKKERSNRNNAIL